VERKQQHLGHESQPAKLRAIGPQRLDMGGSS
jgi:hypothetical protein